MILLVAAVPATADSYQFRINIQAEPLSTALNDLARQTGIELIFDRSLLGGRWSPVLRARLPVALVLQRLLNGTDLSARRATSGAWIVERSQPLGSPFPADLSAPEILVVGRPSQDVDIHRRENDIQPYQVATGEEIVDAHRDNLDEFFQSRITANTVTTPENLTSNGSTNSQIDLRGLGPDQTLILVDGIRLPSVPGSVEFGQPDINAIPLHAIERIETLTGTASGIYGLGALGGVVNVVLRHDYHGLEVHATTGISSQGDARRLNLEAGFGFTPDDGRTDVSLYVSHSWQQPLLEGQNDLVPRTREDLYRISPEDYGTGLGVIPASNSVFVAAASGETLVLKPEFGGASLGSSYSYAPQGFAGTQAKLAALLLEHAGQADLSLSSNEKATDVESTPTTTSVLGNIRHRFGGGFEAYFSALILRDRGRYNNPETQGQFGLSPNSPLNPFQNPIILTFEAPSVPEHNSMAYATARYTLGFVAPLPFSWRANADATFGSSRYEYDLAGGTGLLDYIPDDTPGIDPFAGGLALRQSLTPYEDVTSASGTAHGRYREQSLRLAGPIFQSSAGPATLTLLFQNRDEKSLAYEETDIFGLAQPPYIQDYDAVSRRTRSIYGELEAPLIRKDAAIPVLKGLALQVAIRRDWQRETLPPETGELHPSFAGTMYTVGAKTNPASWLMLRASYATGQQPPPLQNLVESDISDYIALYNDPERGGAQPYNNDQYNLRLGDSAPKNVFARTLSLGVVFNPDGDRAPRLSIDYSVTRKIGDYADPDINLILANDEDRVTRMPLTEADRAMGYTGGVITAIDARGLSTGRVDVRSIDAELDWHLPFADGMLRLYASATCQLEDRESGKAIDTVDFVGYADGSLKWRANGGIQWTRDRTSFGANLQYFGRYLVAIAEAPTLAYVTEGPQGSNYVKAEAYLDLDISRRLHVSWAGTEHDFSLDLGIVNVLNHAPPYDADSGLMLNYSPYGDPRLRRFELSLNAAF